MPILDIILLVSLLVFAVLGFRVGLLRTIGHLVGIIVALIITFNYYQAAAAWLQQIIGGNLTLYKTLAFIVIFGLTNRVIIFIFWLIEKIVVVPLLGLINRLIGALLALLGGILVLGLVLRFLSVLPLNQSLIDYITNSSVSSFLIKTSKLLWPLLPQALKQIPAFF